jgi:hypothetical protein
VSTRAQDQRRRARSRANGSVESFSADEIGKRDNWVCGICRDASHPVDLARRRPDPLAPSVDHIMPVSRGGTHTRGNVQITHWFCNQEKNAYRADCAGVSPEFMRAKLARRLYGTPIPEALWRARFSRWSTRHELMLALHIELGDVAAEPGSEPARSRLRHIAHARGIAEEAFEQDLARMRVIWAPDVHAAGILRESRRGRDQLSDARGAADPDVLGSGPGRITMQAGGPNMPVADTRRPDGRASAVRK